MRKFFLLLFILFNTFMVMRANRSALPVARSPVWQQTQRLLSTRPALLSRTLDWYISWYSYLAGTDLIAVMFSTVNRREWSFLITAKHANGSERILPLPRQSPRRFLQRTFVDNKEAKFHNNLYGNKAGREVYARYLCQEYVVYAGSPLQSIVYKVRSRPFFTREEAQRAGRHKDDALYDQILDEVPCRPMQRLPS